MKDEAEDSSSKVLAPVADNSISSTLVKQPDDNASDDQDDKVKALLSDPRQEEPRSSRKGKTPVPAEVAPKRKKAKKVTTITSENKNSRPEQLANDENDDESVLRNSKRRKTKKEDDNPQIEATNNSLYENVERENSSRSRARSLIDSYRPSYPNNQTISGNDSSVIPPGPRHNPQHYPMPDRVQEYPRFLTHDHNQTPVHEHRIRGGGRTQDQTNGWQQDMKQSLPQHTPQGPKNPHNHHSRSNQAGGARNPAWSSANRPYQDSGARTPGWIQATRTYEDPAPKTPARSGYRCPTPAPRGRTPGYFVDKEPSHSWNHRDSYVDSQPRTHENSKMPNGQQQRSSQRGFTGGIHHHFEDEPDDRLFVSP